MREPRPARTRALALASLGGLPTLRPGAVRVRDERSREREQADCEHDERAVHALDLVHRVPPFRVIEFLPITLGEGANSAVTIR